MQEIDQRDRELLAVLQGEIPLVSTPFAVIGQRIDMSEKEVIKRAERMKRDGVVRHLGAQFDTRALGYRSCLVACHVDEERIDEAAAIITAHPGVSQNYRRNHPLNLWFTIAIAPTSTLGLERTIEALTSEAGCEMVRPLPTLKLFKSASAENGEGSSEGEVEYTPLSANEIAAVVQLQRDLPLQPRPFDVLARGGSISGDDIVAAAKTLQSRGQLRRISATVHQKKGGFTATAMGVWAVPADRVEEVAAQFSANRAVSHCYLRPVYEDWPYNLFTTVHGRSVDECESIIHDLAIDGAIEERRALFPMKEYKKARVQLFSRDAEAWEERHASSRAVAAS